MLSEEKANELCARLDTVARELVTRPFSEARYTMVRAAAEVKAVASEIRDSEVTL